MAYILGSFILGNVSILTNRIKLDSVSGELLDSVSYREDLDYDFISYKECSVFSKLFRGYLPSYSRLVYFGYFDILCRHLQRYSNVLFINGRVSLLSDICKLLGVSSSSVKRFLRESKSLGVILYYNRSYVFNPVYVMNGRGIDPILFSIFKKDRKFVDSLTSLQIIKYNKLTGDDYFNEIRLTFFDIYMSKFKEQL